MFPSFSFYRSFLIPFLLSSLVSFQNKAICQCTVCADDASYCVTVDLVLTGLDFNCHSWGYHYELLFDYAITYTGTPPSVDLYTYSTYWTCNVTGDSFNGNHLPDHNYDNSGSMSTSNNQAYSNPSGCNSDTPQSLDCELTQLRISGQNLSLQDIYNCQSSALPITLSYFKASLNEKAVTLEWVTTSEQNNSHFIIEKSEDADNWHFVAQVEGNGNSTSELKYEFIDQNMDASKIHYRMHQVDYDGKKSIYYYTEVYNKEDQELQLYPNPLSNILTIQGTLTLDDELTFYNALGKDVTNSVQLKETSIGLTADFSDLKNGIYLLKTETNAYRIIKD